MFKKINRENKKGFTLAELLIVVAIIGVLVAVSIPIFTSQLEKSKEATDVANVRSAYAEVMTMYLEDGADHSMSVAARQGMSGWQGASGTIVTQISGKESSIKFNPKKAGSKYVVKIATTGTGKSAKTSVTVS